MILKLKGCRVKTNLRSCSSHSLELRWRLLNGRSSRGLNPWAKSRTTLCRPNCTRQKQALSDGKVWNAAEYAFLSGEGVIVID